jgi:hypothetical protein
VVKIWHEPTTQGRRKLPGELKQIYTQRKAALHRVLRRRATLSCEDIQPGHNGILKAGAGTPCSWDRGLGGGRGSIPRRFYYNSSGLLLHRRLKLGLKFEFQARGGVYRLVLGKAFRISHTAHKAGRMSWLRELGASGQGLGELGAEARGAPRSSLLLLPTESLLPLPRRH